MQQKSTTLSLHSTRIKSILVYPSCAAITREIELTLQAESKDQNHDYEIVITDIPNHVLQDSICIFGYGDAQLVKTSFKTYPYDPNDEKKKKKQELETRVGQLEQEKEILEQGLKDIQNQRLIARETTTNLSLVRGEKNCLKTMLSTKSFEEVEKHMKFLSESFVDLDEKERKLKNQLDVCKKSIKEVRKQISNIKFAPTENRLQVSIFVQYKETCKLELYYLTNACTWIPEYDFKLISKESSLQVLYYGKISQSTDEDWIDVKLGLTTANTSLNNSPPSLGTQHVGFSSLKPRSSWMRFFSGSNNKTVSDDVETMKQKVGQIVESNNVAAFTYDIQHLVSIPSDKLFHRIIVSSDKLSCKLSYQTVPKKEQSVYLFGKIVNTAKYPLMAGNVAVYVDNEYIASKQFDGVNPGETCEVYFGVDPGVKVVYSKPFCKSSTSGIFNNYNKITVEKSIQIKSTKADSIKLVIVDELPRSTSDKITVTLLKPKLKGFTPAKNVKIKNFVVDEIGMNADYHIKWRMNLKPGQEITLPFEYTIEYPIHEEITDFV